MPRIHVSTTTSANSRTCWKLLADFAHINYFNPNLSNSYLLPRSGESDGEIGVGTLRQCDLRDGKNFIRERIIDWQPGTSYTVDIYEGSMPLDKSISTIGVRPNAGGGSTVYMDFEYTPSFGILGRIMNLVMLRPMMTSMLQKVVDGLAQKAEIATDRNATA